METADTKPSTGQEILNKLDLEIKKEFESNRQILTFDEYLMFMREHAEKQMRGSAGYCADMMDFFGKEEIEDLTASDRGRIYRFKIFDRPIGGIAPKLVGHETVQTSIYHALRSFERQKSNNRLLLLHGPNGSAKSTLIRGIMEGMSEYSLTDEGAVYTFNWVFPVEKSLKSEIGIQSYTNKSQDPESYAKLPEHEITSRIPSEMKDHPILLIPGNRRRAFLENLIGKDRTAEIYKRAPHYLTEGGLSHRSHLIFEALLNANGGDFKKVMKHVQVERFYFSRRYRSGLVTIEPQLHVDANYQQVTIDKSLGSLPTALQNLNFFTVGGDLVDGNRGIIEYSDLLKRPVDAFKYLLTACETSSINIGSTIALLDTLMLGSSNELQLDAFKEFPDFSSFKARFELIRVPYLLSVTKEEELYKLLIDDLSMEKPVAPHVAWVLALWAVLTRLKKPNSINYPPNVSSLVSNLTPIQKARLYDNGELPGTLSPDERKILRSNLRKVKEEYSNIPYYEGRMGASVREIKSLLYDAAQNPEHSCLSPVSIFSEMEKFVKRVSEYDFLKQDVKDGFHDAPEFINLVREEYLDRIDREIRSSMGLYDSLQWEAFLKKYVNQVSHVLKKEKIRNSMTGKAEDPDLNLIKEFEGIVEAPKDAKSLEAFRRNVISQIGAWSLDNKSKPVEYANVFPEFWTKLEKHYFESQKALLTRMHNALLLHGTDQYDPHSEGSRLAQKTIENMKNNLGYCDTCATEIITLLMKKRY